MNIYYIAGFPVSDELYHHGILGQKWGIRRYQNPDGTLTAEGKARYGRDVTKMSEKHFRTQVSNATKAGRLKRYEAVASKHNKEYMKTDEAKAYNKTMQSLYERQQKLKELFGPYAQLTIGAEEAALITHQQRAAVNKGQELIRKYADEFADALLKDLDYDVTKEGKDYVKRVTKLI